MTMTREDALKMFITVKERSEHFKECGCRFPLWTITERDEEAIDMAIEALSESNVHNLHSGDIISKEEVLRAIITAEEVEPDLGYTHLYDVIESLPSAEADKIVLCEDCRYRNTWDNPRLEPQYYKCGRGVKFRDYGYVREDDYCPLGERREE